MAVARRRKGVVVTVYVSFFLFFVFSLLFFSLFFFFSLSFVRLFSDCITAKEKMHRCARVFPPSGAHILPRVRAQWCSLLPREQRLAPPPPSFRERYRRIFLCATRIIKSSDPSLRCTSTNVYIRYNNSWNRSNPLILEFEIRLHDDEKLEKKIVGTIGLLLYADSS